MTGIGELWLLRHGETKWTLSGAHTSYTDIPLTEQGEQRAREMGARLSGRKFALTLSSPMRRALETGQLAGYAPEICDDLREWNYGQYEGRTTAEIQKTSPGWTIWTGTPKGGETAEQVGARADRVIQRALSAGGDVALFGHGHMLRVLAARWLGLDPTGGRLFALSTSSASILGYEHNSRVIRLWNQTSGNLP